ncbi:ras-related protein Rab-1D [Lingula anatina]|uniref:Ras-related protein Rab-1D n=1 Tax=Lingula anatina TaxID=7574 RepID=A0A1S3IH49_LINAN|nr:ras-related protein Rab-1D [Lingula anatina]|eukprot:XP_013397196.1 ras-related protein Rab-1D [Lingula anatina]
MENSNSTEESDSESDMSFKVIMIGKYGVGKSSLFRRFMKQGYSGAITRKDTIGMDHYKRTFIIDGHDIKVTMWDTGGMERASLTGGYYRQADGVILCFSLTDPESFNCLSQSMLEVAMYCSVSKLFICGTKVDEISRDHDPHSLVTEDDIEIFKAQCGDEVVGGVYQVSAKTGAGVEEMFDDVARVLRDELDQKRREISRIRLGAELNEGVPSENKKTCAC